MLTGRTGAQSGPAPDPATLLPQHSLSSFLAETKALHYGADLVRDPVRGTLWAASTHWQRPSTTVFQTPNLFSPSQSYEFLPVLPALPEFAAHSHRFQPAAAFSSNGRLFTTFMAARSDGTEPRVFVARRTSPTATWQIPILLDTEDAHSPRIAIDRVIGGNPVYVVWNTSPDPGVPHQIRVARSTDGGLTYAAPVAINDTDGEEVGSPHPAVGIDGELYVAFANAGDGAIHIDRSADGGATWGTDHLVHQWQLPGTGVRSSWGNPANPLGNPILGGLDVDRSAGPHRGAVYVVYNDISEDGSGTLDVYLRRSSDRGQTWSAPVRVNTSAFPSTQFLPRVAVDQTTGEVHVAWYDTRHDTVAARKATVYYARSLDGGATFETDLLFAEISGSFSAAAPADLSVPLTGFTQGYGDSLGLIADDSTVSVAFMGKSQAYNTPSLYLRELTYKDFSLSAPAAAVVAAGSSSTFEVELDGTRMTMEDTALSVSGLPAGVTATFSPISTAGQSGSATLTLTASGTAAAAVSSVTINATAGPLARSATVSLTTQSFTISSNAPSSIVVNKAGPLTFSLSAARLNGFAGNVDLSVEAPAHILVSVVPATLTPGNDTAVVTVEAQAEAVIGSTFTLTARAVAGGLTRTLTFTGRVVLREVELIRNGSFEISGTTDWQSSGEIERRSVLPAHDGSFYQETGDDVSQATPAMVAQSLTIPAGALTANLTLWVQGRTDDTSSTAKDLLKVEVYRGGAIVKTFTAASNKDITSAWTRRGPFDLSAYAGDLIMVRLSSYGDNATGRDNDETIFRIDDVSLRAGMATPPAVSTTIVSAANTTYGQPITLTADVSAGGMPVEYETVTFRSGSTVLGTRLLTDDSPAPKTPGRAVLTVPPGIAAGAQTFTAEFAGSVTVGASAGATTVTVAPAPLTVRANDTTRVYGFPNPLFTATFTGLMAGDTASSLGLVHFETTATPVSAAGTYPITPSGLPTGNYDITYQGGQLTVTPTGRAVTLTPTAGALDEQHSPDLAVDPTNPLHVIGAFNEWSAALQTVSVVESFDGGESWERTTLTPPATHGLRAPAVAFDAAGGAYVTWNDMAEFSLSTQIVISYKAAGAGAWDAPITLDTMSDTAVREADTDGPLPRVAIDRQGNNRVYVMWTGEVPVNPGDTLTTVVVRRSASGATPRTFAGEITVNDGGGDYITAPQVVVGPGTAGTDSPVYAVWLDEINTIRFDRSLDGGATWGADRTVATRTVPHEYGDYTRLDAGYVHLPVSVDVDRSTGPHRGTIYVVYADRPVAANGFDIFLKRSTDGGTTWSAPLRVNSDSTGAIRDQMLPKVTVSERNGAVHVIWYDTRNDLQNANVDVYHARSIDGGLSFADNGRVSPLTSPLFQSGYHLGLAAGPQSVFAAWTDMSFGPRLVSAARIVFPDFAVLPVATTIATGLTRSVAVETEAFEDFSHPLTLSVTGLPSGVTAMWPEDTIDAGSSGMLLLTASPSAPTGTFAATLRATAGDDVRTATLMLTVGPPNYSLAITPATRTTEGAPVTFELAAHEIVGPLAPAVVSVSGLPAGASFTLSEPAIAMGGTVTLTVFPGTESIGTFSPSISTITAGVTKTIGVTYTYDPPNFSMAASPGTKTLPPDPDARFTITTVKTGGSPLPAFMSVTGLPMGASASFSVNPVAIGGATVMTVEPGNAPSGTYSLTITGIAGPVVRTATVTLTITSDFALTSTVAATPTPVFTLDAGGTTSINLQTTALGSFNSAITISAASSPALPTATASKVTMTVRDTSIDAPGSGATVISFEAAPGAAAATYAITATAAGGGKTHTFVFNITVVRGTRQLVFNGSFSQGSGSNRTGWTKVGDNHYTDSSGQSGKAHMLGAFGGESAGIYQDVAIPEGATDVQLSFWYMMSNINGSTGATGARLAVTAPDTSWGDNDVLHEYLHFPNTSYILEDKNDDSEYDLTNYAGEVRRLYFFNTSQPDVLVQSFFHIDTVSVTCTCGGIETTTAMESSLGATFTYGAATTLTATVTSPLGPVTEGAVTFEDGDSVLATVTLDGNGVATLPARVFGGGRRAITAKYVPPSAGHRFAASTDPDFITVNPAPLTVTADAVTRNYGMPDPPFTFTVTGLVNGETLATSGMTGVPALTTTATAASAAGVYPLTAATGSLKSTNYSFTFVPGTLTVADFSLTASPASRTLGANLNSTYTVTATALHGFTGTVDLAALIPIGATATFNPPSIDANGGTSEVTIHRGTALPANHTLTLSGTSAGVGDRPGHNPTVTWILRDFSIAVSPATQAGTPGQTVDFALTTARLNNFSTDNEITFSVTGLPSGVSASFPTNPVVPGTGATMRLTVGNGVTGGSYPLVIKGQSNVLAHTVSATLTLGNFSLTAPSGTPTLNHNASLDTVITSAVTGGFNQPVTFTHSALPSGVTAAFLPSNTLATGAGAVTLRFSADATAVKGTATITVTATAANGVTHTKNVKFKVNAATTTTLEVDAPISATEYGTPRTLTGVVRQNGAPVTTGHVSFALDGIALPGGSAVPVGGDGRAALVTTLIPVGSSHTVTASYAANAAYDGSSTTQPAPNVLPRTLIVKAANVRWLAGTPLPPLDVEYEGLVNGDTAASLGLVPTVSTTATPASPPGSTWPITVSGTDVLANYFPVYAPGTLSVAGLTLSGPGIVAVSRNDSTTKTLTITAEDFEAPVTLTAVGLPDYITVSFSPATLPAPGTGTVTMTVTAAAAALRGGFPLVIVASGGGTSTELPIDAAVFSQATVELTGTTDVTWGDTAVHLTALVTYQGQPVTDGTITFINGVVNNGTVLAANVPLDATGRATLDYTLPFIFNHFNRGQSGSAVWTFTAVLDPTPQNEMRSDQFDVNAHRAVLVARPADVSRPSGEANPPFDLTFSGFVNGETEATAEMMGTPSVTTAATPSSPAGTYPIVASKGSLSSMNYEFVFEPGTLTVTKLPQTMTFDQPAAPAIGGGPVALTAYTSAVLPVNLVVVSGPGTLTGNLLTATGPGTIVVRATQDGDDTYLPADSIERSVAVTAAGPQQISGNGFIDDARLARATFSVNASTVEGAAGSVTYNHSRSRLAFVSSGITGVTVSGTTFTITGLGKVNGGSGYSFTATAVDGSPDAFGIVIRRGDGSVYYSAPLQAMTGGGFTVLLH